MITMVNEEEIGSRRRTSEAAIVGVCLILIAGPARLQLDMAGAGHLGGLPARAVRLSENIPVNWVSQVREC
jgi:hypothetical protein